MQEKEGGGLPDQEGEGWAPRKQRALLAHFMQEIEGGRVVPPEQECMPFVCGPIHEMGGVIIDLKRPPIARRNGSEGETR